MVAGKDQSTAIVGFIQAFKEPIMAAQALGASVTIDVAIEPEDAGRIPLVLREEPELMGELVRAGVSLEISIYFSAALTARTRTET